MPSSIQGICVAQPFELITQKLRLVPKTFFHLIETYQGLALSLFSDPLHHLEKQRINDNGS
jgi:hypothetical protein